MKIGTIAFYAFASATICGALSGCATTGEQSQLAPGITPQSGTESSTNRRASIPPHSIFVGYGLAPDSYINVYSGESGNWGKIGKISSNVATPVSMRFYRDGKLYVADEASNAVSTYTDGNYDGSLTESLTEPYQLALDASSNLAVINTMSSEKPRVTVFPTGSGTPYVILKNLAVPSDAIFDDAGDLFVANYKANNVVEFGPGGDKVISVITDGVDQPLALAIDYIGTLWVANAGAHNATEYGYAGLIRVIDTGDLRPSALFTHDTHLYIGASSTRLHHPDEIIDYNLSNDTKTEITDGVKYPKEFAWCEPDLCLMNIDSVAIYNSDDTLVHTIKEAKEIPRSIAVSP
jgi:hypothetical protein